MTFAENRAESATDSHATTKHAAARQVFCGPKASTQSLRGVREESISDTREWDKLSGKSITGSPKRGPGVRDGLPLGERTCKTKAGYLTAHRAQ